jgi:hypothetical protein
MLSSKRKPARKRKTWRAPGSVDVRVIDDVILISLPLVTVSEANRASHEHWRYRHARANVHRSTAFAATLRAVGQSILCEPVARMAKHGRTARPVLHGLACLGWGSASVKIIRVGPRRLDWDNAVGSVKHVGDGIADALTEGKDNDPRLVWQAEQECGEYAVRVRIARVK